MANRSIEDEDFPVEAAIPEILQRAAFTRIKAQSWGDAIS
jgi:hypothetical protein